MYDDDDEIDDRDDAWDEDDDETDVVPCPGCGADVYEDAEQCPACGQSIVHSTSPWHGRPRWWILLGLAGIAAVLWMLIPCVIRQEVLQPIPVPERSSR